MGRTVSRTFSALFRLWVASPNRSICSVVGRKAMVDFMVSFLFCFFPRKYGLVFCGGGWSWCEIPFQGVFDRVVANPELAGNLRGGHPLVHDHAFPGEPPSLHALEIPMIPLSSGGVGVGKMGGSCPQVFLHLLGQILGHPDVALEILLQLEHQGLKVVDGCLKAVDPIGKKGNC